jgi:hypothetical protein
LPPAVEAGAPPPDATDPSGDDFVLGAGFDFANPKSRLAPLYLRSSHVVAVALLALVFVLMSHLPVWHTDVWGHLRFGEYMVTTGRLPEREMFSGDFADQDTLYVNYQWLTQAGAYLLFDAGRHLAPANADARLGGGALLLTAAHAAIVTLRLLVLLLAFRRLTTSTEGRQAGSTPTAVAGVVIVVAMSVFCHLFILRPQILGELGFALLLFMLSRPLLSRPALVLIPLLFVLWANTHGSFLVGLVLLGTFLAGRAIEVVWDPPGLAGQAGSRLYGRLAALLRDQQVRRLTLVVAVAVLAVAALNPHGPYLFLYTWRLSNHPNIRFLEEWKPLPNLQSLEPGKLLHPTGLMFFASLLALVPLALWSRARWTPTQVLLVLLFGVQALLHARVVVWWIMVFPWVAVPHLHSLCLRLRLPWVREEIDQPNLRKTILAGMVAVVLLLWSAPLLWLCWGDVPAGSRWVTPQTPWKAAAYLKRQYQDNPSLSRCVFTSETLGEYLLWDLRLEPPVRIFCYTHVHLLTPGHWQECMKVKNGDRDWEAILDRHQVAFLVVEPDLHPRLTERILAAEERWEIVPKMGPNLVARRK